MAAVKAPVKHAAKVKALHVHRAMALLHHAETDHRAHKAHRALKAKAMVAVKAVATVVAAKTNAATRVLTTVAMVKAVPHRVVHAQRAVVQAVARKAAMVKAATRVVKTAAAMTVTSCHATSIP